MNDQHQLKEFSEIASALVKMQEGCIQMKQGALINTVFPHTKRSVNYRTISGTRHLNKYLIKLEQSTRMFDKKNSSQFLVNANGLYSNIKEGFFFPVCQEK